MKIGELNFEKHPNWGSATRATHMFPNGFGVSVIAGEGSYTSEDKPYELAVLDENGINYTSGITDDVLGYLSEDDINELLLKVEDLPSQL
jgi:hypothetical protein